jgi:outer membrane immunogenic protein
MKKGLLSMAAVAALVGTPALAADMALKAPPPPPAPIWSGWYFGANGGGGWENATWTFPTVQFFATAAGQSFSTNPNGGIAGGQFGYNYQFGHWVVGGEFMGDWSGLSQKVVGPVPAFPFDSYTTKLSDLESLTLRFGYAPRIGWSTAKPVSPPAELISAPFQEYRSRAWHFRIRKGNGARLSAWASNSCGRRTSSSA